VLSVYDYWLFCPLSTLVDAEDRVCRRRHGRGCLACLPRVLRPVQAAFLELRRRLFEGILDRVDRFAVLSRASGALLEDFGVPAHRIRVIPLPMDLDAFAPDDTPVVPGLVLYAGWVQKRKGLDVLLRAMPSILARHPEARLEVLGMPVKWEAEYEARIEARVRELDLGGRVSFRGKLPFADLRRRVREAAVVVIPEQWENMSPVLLLECLLMGSPVVASRVGGIPEFVEDGVTGLLFDRTDPEDLASRIGDVLGDVGGIVGSIRERAPGATRRILDPEAIRSAWLALYEELRASGRRGGR
jgi:glycosyltransferase involved in cell wall biosynthesis